MENMIERRLANPEIKSQKDLKKYMADMQARITTFEKQMYNQEEPDEVLLAKIKKWRQRLLEILKNNRQLPEDEDPDEVAGIETLKLLNRQIDHADMNQKILDQSTLKLVTLDFSANELDKVIVDTRNKLSNSLKKERVEYRRLMIAFVVFIFVCIGILYDKIINRT